MQRARQVSLWIVMIAAVSGVHASLPAQAIHEGKVTKGTLAFDGRATLGDFTGTTGLVKGELTGATSIDGIHGWVEAPSRSLVTGNGKRDRDMYGSLEVDKYATLRFDLLSATAGAVSGDSIAVTLHGKFTIHGQVRDADVAGWVWLGSATTRFRGSTPMDARDYQIGGLTKMLGVLKMNPKITVRMDVTFER